MEGPVIDTKQGEMDRMEDWSGGGLDSAYFSQHSIISDRVADTPRKQRKGWYPGLSVCHYNCSLQLKESRAR